MKVIVVIVTALVERGIGVLVLRPTKNLAENSPEKCLPPPSSDTPVESVK
jgi:hypothetical protein